MLTSTPACYRDVLLRLLQKLSYRNGDFILSSGERSPYYIDCRQTTLTARGVWLSCVLFLQIIEEYSSNNKIEFQAVAGVELGAVPLITAVSIRSFLAGMIKPMEALIVRKSVKGHGTKKLIEGHVQAGNNIVLVEDVVTTGNSVIGALNVLRDAGLKVDLVLSLVDRCAGGADKIRKNKVTYKHLYTINDFR